MRNELQVCILVIEHRRAKQRILCVCFHPPLLPPRIVRDSYWRFCSGQQAKNNLNRNGIQIYHADRQTVGTNAIFNSIRREREEREGRRMARDGERRPDHRDHLFKINYKFHLNRHLTSLPPFA